jgi:hypothetical protein
MMILMSPLSRQLTLKKRSWHFDSSPTSILSRSSLLGVREKGTISMSALEPSTRCSPVESGDSVSVGSDVLLNPMIVRLSTTSGFFLSFISLVAERFGIGIVYSLVYLCSGTVTFAF